MIDFSWFSDRWLKWGRQGIAPGFRFLSAHPCLYSPADGYPVSFWWTYEKQISLYDRMNWPKVTKNASNRCIVVCAYCGYYFCRDRFENGAVEHRTSRRCNGLASLQLIGFGFNANLWHNDSFIQLQTRNIAIETRINIYVLANYFCFTKWAKWFGERMRPVTLGQPVFKTL